MKKISITWVSIWIGITIIAVVFLLATMDTVSARYPETPKTLEEVENTSLTIVKDGDPILREVCNPVELFDEHLATLLDEMTETMRDADGIGIAGPQVGLSLRICVIDCQDGGGTTELINPEIIAFSGKQTEKETCLSFPGRVETVTRPMEVTVRAQDRNGDWFEVKSEGLKARVLCHEIDHLDGVCFTDIAE